MNQSVEKKHEGQKESSPETTKLALYKKYFTYCFIETGKLETRLWFYSWTEWHQVAWYLFKMIKSRILACHRSWMLRGCPCLSEVSMVFSRAQWRMSFHRVGHMPFCWMYIVFCGRINLCSQYLHVTQKESIDSGYGSRLHMALNFTH